MAAPHVEWTVEMLDALEDDGQRYELIDGELFVTPAPAEPHQLIVGELHVRLREYLMGKGVGKAIVSPADVRRGDRARNRVQPDVFVVRITAGGRPPYPYGLLDLLLAVEVGSPSSSLLDYQRKRDLYLREGVLDYWIIRPEAQNISRWRGRDEPGEVISTQIEWHPAGMLAPLVINLADFFAQAYE